MSEYGEYTTIEETRKLYLGSVKTVDDVLLLKFIRQVTTEITAISNRTFYPVYATNKYNTPKAGYEIFLDGDLMELISITNGNSVAVDITKVDLFPLNAPTKNKLYMNPVDGVWMTKPNGSIFGAISVEGIWCNRHDPTAGWETCGTLSANINASITTVNVTPHVVNAGSVIKIGTEYMYVVSAVNTIIPADPLHIPPILADEYDILTVKRGANGTTAAVHTAVDAVYLWVVDHDISMLAAAASVAYYNLKSNPQSSSTTIDGVTYETPKDVTKFIKERLNNITLLRLAFA